MSEYKLDESVLDWKPTSRELSVLDAGVQAKINAAGGNHDNKKKWVKKQRCRSRGNKRAGVKSEIGRETCIREKRAVGKSRVR